MQVDMTITVACAVALFLVVCFGCLARRSFVKYEREAELNAPLIDSDDRRLDAALRDAEEGFNVCAVCAFENFKRLRFCTVCGEPIVVDDEQQKEKEPKALLSAIFRRKSKVRLTSSTSLLTSSRHSTRRQVRAQRRKEWTRKLDVEGRAYWFRDNTFGGDSTTFPGFVVKFEAANGIHGVVDETEPQREVPEHCTTRESTVATSEANGGVKAPAHATSFQPDSNTDEPDPELEHDAENEEYSNGTTTPPRPPVGSIEERLETLTRDTSTKHPKFNSASDVDMDAFKLPLDVQNGSSPAVGEVTPSASLAESMTLATKNFPSKYAHFVMRASALLVPAEREHLRLSIERARVYKDSMESLAIIPVRNTHSVMRINFLDESGVDAGGLHREWFVMLNEALVDPANGLLVCANKNEHTYFLTRCSNADLLPRQLVYLFALGRLVGRALLEGSMLCFHLAPPLLKLMLGYPLSLTDLEDLDPEVYTNLRWLLENDNVDALGLDFTVTIKDGGKYKDVELVPNGKDVTVTDANKREYVERKWQYLLVESVAPQLQVFLQGLYEIIPRDLLLLFDPEEFDFLLCGSDEIDVDDWERNTKYSEDLHHHRALMWFWELVREMPNEYRRRLLQFATGSSRVPLGGFSALTSYDGRLCPFTLKAVSLIGDGFIHSHACFNRLDLPLHVVRDELKAVLYAVLETELYGFTTT